MEVALLDVLSVGFVALGIALLDATARGGVVASYGEADDGVVLQLEGELHETLTEGATADDERAVEVLHSTGEDLAGAGTALVHQHDQRELAQTSVTRALEVLTGIVCALVVDEEVALGEELRSECRSGLQIAPAIVAEVDEDALDAFGGMLGIGLLEL